MRKFVVTIICLIFLAFGIGSSSAASDMKEHTRELVKWMISNPSGSSDMATGIVGGLAEITRSLDRKEDISGFDYEWRFDMHTISVMYYIDENKKKYQDTGLYITLREYQMLSTGCRQQIIWILLDIDGDGMIDVYDRDYRISYFDERTNGWFFVCPSYPKGFRDFSWYDIPYEVTQDKFEKEVQYWLNVKKSDS